MNPKEIAAAIERYNKRLDEYGETEQALGWGAKGRSKLRYKILTWQWKLEGRSILDFGCGFGDLYDYIAREINTSIHYTGIDINPRLIEIAQSKNRENARFICGNLLDKSPVEDVDYILSSGVFNYKLEENIGFITAAFDRFDKIATKGFAVNFMSDKAEIKYETNYYANPAQILELAYRYSNNVVLRNDYMPYEFTVFVNKDIGIDPNLTVYNNYSQYV